MSMASIDDVVSGLANTSRQRFSFNKPSVTNSVGYSGFTSLWKVSGGYPLPGATPTTTAAVCDNTTLGGFPLTAASPLNNYVTRVVATSTVAGISYEFHDRIAHVGGFSASVTTAQTVNLDLSTLSIAANRLTTNYSNVQWWLECYTNTGTTTSATATITYVDAAGNTKTAPVIPYMNSLQASFLISIVPVDNVPIRAITKVQLSASTGAAGNFGFTATSSKFEIPMLSATGTAGLYDWASVGLPLIPDTSCLTIIAAAGATANTGSVSGSIVAIQG